MATILLALGVSRETIMNDYLLWNMYQRGLSRRFPAHMTRVAIAMMQDVHDSYLQSSFAAIDEEWGSDDAFLKDTLDLGAAEKERLAALLLVD